MHWLFWVLIGLGLLLLLAPFAGLFPAITAFIWMLGAVMLIVALVWAIIIMFRSTPPPAPPA